MSQQTQSFRTIANVSTTLSTNDSSINLTNTLLNSILGSGAATKNLSGRENTVLGNQALLASTGGDQLVAIGCLAAGNLVAATGAVFVGDRVAPVLISGSDSVLIGMSGGANVLYATSSVMIGPNTGVLSLGSKIIDAVSIGSRAMTGGLGSTSVGARSVATGDASVCIGYCNIHHSSGGITVGASCSNTCENSIIIGNGLGYEGAPGESNNLTIVAGRGTGRLNIQNVLTGRPNLSTRVYDLQLATPSGSISLLAPTGVVASGGLSAQTLTTPSITVSSASATSRSPSWNIALTLASVSTGADLLLTSSNGTQVTFCDDFVPGVLNFTAQHRCAVLSPIEMLPPGSIVVASGTYSSLDGSTLPTIDESVPVVEASTRARDPRVFGVISSHEPPHHLTDRRSFRLGSLGFSLHKHPEETCARAVVNAGGEGGILVCDSNGPIRNGDLLVSSDRRGLAMRQGDDLVRSSTVAKATCDCFFVSVSGAVLIGCTYMC